MNPTPYPHRIGCLDLLNPLTWLRLLREIAKAVGHHLAVGRQVSRLKPETRQRMSRRVLIHLVKSGWHEGRSVAARFINPPDHQPPPALTQRGIDILQEFGGLHVGGWSRPLMFGDLGGCPVAHSGQLSRLIGSTLCPIAFTMQYGDDGQILYADDLGRIYLDYFPLDGISRKGQLQYIASTLEGALEIMLGPRPLVFEPRSHPTEPRTWAYEVPAEAAP